ncbi:uncharacterized protein LOC128789708 [Vidua chalybeata]|uniref:uncharacterized protein LOC128789708 n=1 Tax=Vidua chalybeata TaxID=81927 RepID=UPI0023A7BFFE|nr:uncharacterized protein LOC128789177 isoform X2 [Vidua chalybeata]XP_053801849.1 uncharacterized protein LOC128789708 [Vidua chalybeata]
MELPMISFSWGLFRLMMSSTVLDMCDFCKLCCHCSLPRCLFWVVDSIQYCAFFALFAVIPPVTFLCPSHQQGHCLAALISMHTVILLLLAAPMLVSSIILLNNAKCGSQQQQPKRCNIIIVFTVLLTLLLSLWNFLQQLGYTFVPSQVVFLLACINSSIKPFICFLAGRCWRPCSMGSLWLSLQRVFEYQKKKTARRNDAPGPQWSEPVDPFHCSAEQPLESG